MKGTVEDKSTINDGGGEVVRSINMYRLFQVDCILHY